MHLKFRPLEVLVSVIMLFIFVIVIFIISIPDLIFGYKRSNYG